MRRVSEKTFGWYRENGFAETEMGGGFCAFTRKEADGNTLLVTDEWGEGYAELDDRVLVGIRNSRNDEIYCAIYANIETYKNRGTPVEILTISNGREEAGR